MLSKGKEKRSRRNRYRLKKANKSGLRLSVFKSSKHLYAQVIDDDKESLFVVHLQLKCQKIKILAI